MFKPKEKRVVMPVMTDLAWLGTEVLTGLWVVKGGDEQ